MRDNRPMRKEATAARRSYRRMIRYPRLIRVLQRARVWSVLLILIYASPEINAQQQEIRFSVPGLFHPREIQLQPAGEPVLSIAANGVAATTPLILNGEPGRRQLLFRAEGDRVVVGSASAASWTATARDGTAGAFRLSIPGKIHRIYFGHLTLSARNSELQAVVGMDREMAVASIVAAEMDQSAPIEALKAQAVATRSFLAAGARHLDFDFCDTTHCQFLRSPPPSNSRVSQAVQATRGLLIIYRGQPLAALYSSRCGGRTRSLREVKMEPGNSYPYYSVLCAWCRKHPFVWHSSMGSGELLKPHDETQRIAAARQWGWSAVPGSDFTAIEDGTNVQLVGHSAGHGVGMCQLGAMGMARDGAAFRQILSHYYPNTALISSL